MKLFIVTDGEATETAETQAPENSNEEILVMAETAEKAIEVAHQYGAGETDYENVAWQGETIAAVR